MCVFWSQSGCSSECCSFPPLFLLNCSSSLRWSGLWLGHFWTSTLVSLDHLCAFSAGRVGSSSSWRINGLWSRWLVKAITFKTSRGVKTFNRLCIKHLKHLVLLFLFQLYIFLLLLHLVSDFQNYLRTQTGNNTTVNIIISTVDYLLRVQVSFFSSQQNDKNPILLWSRFPHRSLKEKKTLLVIWTLWHPPYFANKQS